MSILLLCSTWGTILFSPPWIFWVYLFLSSIGSFSLRLTPEFQHWQDLFLVFLRKYKRQVFFVLSILIGIWTFLILPIYFLTVTYHIYGLQWALMTRLNPSCSLANLICIGYGGDPTSALRVTRRRSADRKKQRTERNVFHCFVFGPKRSGKSAFLNSFLGRCWLQNYVICWCWFC